MQNFAQAPAHNYVFAEPQGHGNDLQLVFSFGPLAIRVSLDYARDKAGVILRQDFDAGITLAQLASTFRHRESPILFIPGHAQGWISYAVFCLKKKNSNSMHS